MVELRSADLVSGGMVFIEGLLEQKFDGLIVVRGIEFDSELGHCDILDCVLHAQLFKERQVHRKKRLTNMKARVMILFDDDDPESLARQQSRNGRAGRPTPHDQNITGHLLRARLRLVQGGSPRCGKRWDNLAGRHLSVHNSSRSRDSGLLRPALYLLADGG